MKLLALALALLFAITASALAVPADIADVDSMRARGMSEHDISASLRTRYPTPSHAHRRHARLHRRAGAPAAPAADAAQVQGKPISDADARATRQTIGAIMSKVLHGGRRAGRRGADAYDGVEALVVRPRGEHHW